MKIFIKISDLFGSNNKTLERLFANKQFLIVVSLVLAFLVYLGVDASANS